MIAPAGAAGPGALEQPRHLLETRRLRIASRIGDVRRTIVSGFDLSVGEGETIGIVGESGSGKSLTAKALIGLLPEGVTADGEVLYQGENLLSLPERRMAALRGTTIGLIFQDPYTMLNPVRRCGRHVTEMLRADDGKRLGRPERRAEAIRRLAEVGIDDPSVIDRYPFQLSGGMRQRVGIAAALARDPKLLIADEPSTALDVTIQKEILALLKSLQTARGMGLILITHDLRVAFSTCDRIYVLYAGAVLEVGTPADLETDPGHPYSLGLLLSEPPVDRRLAKMSPIEGSVPSTPERRDACLFAPRCRWRTPRCLAAAPELLWTNAGRASACVRRDEIQDEMRLLRAAAGQSLEAVARSVDAEQLVRVTGLTKAFSNGSARVRALDGVSLEIGANESVGLVGESGSGKTTLARCLVGLETPSGGEITIGRVDATSYSDLSSAERRALRRTVQIIFQDPYSSLNPALTIGSTLCEALVAHDPAVRDVKKRLEDLLTRVGLPLDYARRKPVALSGGERQRVAIARALAVRPALIICDEPVSALDVSVQAQILDLFRRLRDEFEISYLFITHDLAVVRQIVDRIFVLYRGEIVEQGPVDRVLDSPTHPYTRLLISSVPRSEEHWLTQEADPTAATLRKM